MMRIITKISNERTMFVSRGVLRESTLGLAHFATFGTNPQATRGHRHWQGERKERWGLREKERLQVSLAKREVEARQRA